MNKFKLILGFSFWFLLTAVACNRDEINFEMPSQLLRFSSDTVFCDTVYNQVRSETYAVKIYNDEDKDVMIPKISLEKGAASLYRINVDGKAGTDFNNIPLRKKDSLYIFVEIAPIANAPEAIAEDRVNVETPAGKQHVTLFSVVQDAEFFIETKTNPNILANNTSWTNSKAKIIFGNLTLAEGKSLNIQPGTNVVFYKNSGIKISKNSTLTVNGKLGAEVVFRGLTADRFDSNYEEALLPLNWNSIYFEENSTLNMNYAKIFGGTSGLIFQQIKEATINNTIIHSFQDYGIYSVNSKITANNLVTNSCGSASIGIFKGGNINFTHCTLANYWFVKSGLPQQVIYASNQWKSKNGALEYAPLNLNVFNSIVYGNTDNTITFNKSDGQTFNTNFYYSLIQNSNPNINLNTNSNILNQDPKFQNYYTKKMNLRVKDDSPAKGKGNVTVAASVPTDIVGVSRTASPTIGAYQ